MKSILLGTVVAGLVMVSVPTQSHAAWGGWSFGPTLPASSYVPKRERSFSIFAPAADSSISPRARKSVRLLNDIVFGASGVSRVSRFFGIRDGRF